MILRRVGVLSCGKVLGLTTAAIGMIPGFFMTLVSMTGIVANSEGGNIRLPFAMFGVAALIVIPIFYGVIGFIMGMIQAAIYNAVAGLFGGLELEFVRPAGTVHTP